MHRNGLAAIAAIEKDIKSEAKFLGEVLSSKGMTLKTSWITI